MRLSIIHCFLIAGLAGCHIRDNSSGSNKSGAEQEAILKDTANYTTIRWLDSTHRDFGRIPEGKLLDVTFRFRNTGNRPLVITRVQPSCGCTIAEQPSAPIAAGNEGVIKASFNSERHVGVNHKTLYVFANTKGSTSSELQFDVEVEKNKW